MRRGGALPGDRIVVSGRFGGSILGHHLDFQPRVREAILLNERYRLHAGIDVSDGLAIDLAHIADESGCGAVLDLPSVPIAEDAKRLAKQLDDGRSPLDHALGDGEDFELILAVPPQDAGRMLEDQPLDVLLTDVGEFVKEPGLWQTDTRKAQTIQVAPCKVCFKTAHGSGWMSWVSCGLYRGTSYQPGCDPIFQSQWVEPEASLWSH